MEEIHQRRQIDLSRPGEVNQDAHAEGQTQEEESSLADRRVARMPAGMQFVVRLCHLVRFLYPEKLSLDRFEPELERHSDAP